MLDRNNHRNDDGSPPSSTPRDPRVDSRRTLRSAPASLLALVMMVGGAAGSVRAADFELDPIVASGFRCETRHRAREVVRRQFVLDRTTECRPLLALVSRPASAPAMGDLAIEAASDAEGARPAGEAATWSGDRRRLGNAQYDRSLRAMRGSLSRRPR